MNAIILTTNQVLGIDVSHVVPVGEQPQPRLHARAKDAFLRLQAAAADDGVDIQVASGFRDFERQVSIWNRKYTKLQAEGLDDAAIQATILRWSALPGTSRHHWGSDLDIFDQRSLGSATLQLEPWEYEAGGPCFELFQWLQAHAQAFGFDWPYAEDRGGVSPEPWHLSYHEVAHQASEYLSAEALKKALQSAPLLGKDSVLENLDAILERYVYNVTPSRLATSS